MSPLAILLWLWLATSLCVYAYRIYRRFMQGPKDERQDGEPTELEPTSDQPLGAASALIQNPVAGFQIAPPAPPAPAAPAPSGTSPLPPPDLPAAAPDFPGSAADDHPLDVSDPPEMARPPLGTPTSAPANTPANERRVERRPIGEAIAGVQMPCNLSPLVGDATRIDPFDLAFFTTTHDSDHIRGALAGELLRLGYQVAPTSAHRLTASRADAELVVTIYPNPAKATDAGRPLYPSAGPDAVVARFQS